MRKHRLLSLVVYLIGCYGPESVGTGNNNMMNCVQDAGKPSDLPVPLLQCPAAKGLAGTNLLCVDFAKVTQLTDPALMGWNFNANQPDCWEIKGGVLQVQNFGSFQASCGLILPKIDLLPPATQYTSITLSLLHRVDMNPQEQAAFVFLDQAVSARLAHHMTGQPGFPTLLTTTLTINKADLPAALNSSYKFFLQVLSLNNNGARKGWQIQSIAINGNL